MPAFLARSACFNPLICRDFINLCAKFLSISLLIENIFVAF